MLPYLAMKHHYIYSIYFYYHPIFDKSISINLSSRVLTQFFKLLQLKSSYAQLPQQDLLYLCPLWESDEVHQAWDSQLLHTSRVVLPHISRCEKLSGICWTFGERSWQGNTYPQSCWSNSTQTAEQHFLKRVLQRLPQELWSSHRIWLLSLILSQSCGSVTPAGHILTYVG